MSSDDKNGSNNNKNGKNENDTSSSSSSERNNTFNSRRRVTIERRSTMPIELEDPEDCTIGEAESELFQGYHDEDDDDYDETSDYYNSQQKTIGIYEKDYDQMEDGLLKSIREKIIHLPREGRNIIAGGIAGIVAKSVVAPFDRLKILYQVSSAQFHLRDIPNVVRNIITNEGLSALWKGNTATLIRVFPYSGIQFMVFDRCKRYFLHHNDTILIEQHIQNKQDNTSTNNQQQQQQQQQVVTRDRKWGLTPLQSLVSGMIAGTVSVICTYPLDLTRAQLAVLKRKKHHNLGFGRVFLNNYTRGGFAGLFRGITPTLLGILPYSGIAFTINEQGKREILHLTGREATTIERMQCGAFAGLVAQTVTYPIEVTRRRMQTVGLIGDKSCETALSSLGGAAEVSPTKTANAATIIAETTTSHHQHNPTLKSIVLELYAGQGIRGFLKGVSLNWMKGPLAFSISFTAFDTVQKFIESPTERSMRLPKRLIVGTNNTNTPTASTPNTIRSKDGG